MDSFTSKVAGIPCVIKVDRFYVTQGTYSRQAETPDEYYGAQEIEFTVCDRNGRPAAWLERKLTDDDCSRIEEEAIEAAREYAECY